MGRRRPVASQVGSHAALSDEARQAPLAAQVCNALVASAFAAAWAEDETMHNAELIIFITDLVQHVSVHEPT